MREIQFRVWYPEKQKMYEVAKVDMWGDQDQATCDLAAIDEELFDIYLHEVETMQYTGLKDKNGTEIYDSDLLTDMVGDIFEVFYNTAHCAYMAKYVRAKHAEKKRGYFRLGDQCSLTIAVIGNIWENPELLK